MRLNFRSDSSSIYTERGTHVFHSVFSGIFSAEQRSSHGKINIDIKQQSSYLNIFLVFLKKYIELYCHKLVGCWYTWRKRRSANWDRYSGSKFLLSSSHHLQMPLPLPSNCAFNYSCFKGNFNLIFVTVYSWKTFSSVLYFYRNLTEYILN